MNFSRVFFLLFMAAGSTEFRSCCAMDWFKGKICQLRDAFAAESREEEEARLRLERLQVAERDAEHRDLQLSRWLTVLSARESRKDQREHALAQLIAATHDGFIGRRPLTCRHTIHRIAGVFLHRAKKGAADQQGLLLAALASLRLGWQRQEEEVQAAVVSRSLAILDLLAEDSEHLLSYREVFPDYLEHAGLSALQALPAPSAVHFVTELVKRQQLLPLLERHACSVYSGETDLARESLWQVLLEASVSQPELAQFHGVVRDHVARQAVSFRRPELCRYAAKSTETLDLALKGLREELSSGGEAEDFLELMDSCLAVGVAERLCWIEIQQGLLDESNVAKSQKVVGELLADWLEEKRTSASLVRAGFADVAAGFIGCWKESADPLAHRRVAALIRQLGADAGSGEIVPLLRAALSGYEELFWKEVRPELFAVHWPVIVELVFNAGLRQRGLPSPSLLERALGLQGEREALRCDMAEVKKVLGMLVEWGEPSAVRAALVFLYNAIHENPIELWPQQALFAMECASKCLASHDPGVFRAATELIAVLLERACQVQGEARRQQAQNVEGTGAWVIAQADLVRESVVVRAAEPVVEHLAMKLRVSRLVVYLHERSREAAATLEQARRSVMGCENMQAMGVQAVEVGQGCYADDDFAFFVKSAEAALDRFKKVEREQRAGSILS